MAVTTAEEPTPLSQGRLRHLDPLRDLGPVADLIADAFAGEMDARGRSALRELRWMARLSPLVWWWAGADPTFADNLNGFVWEERAPGGKRWQVVGNASLGRAPGSKQRWIICNVVVRKEYQGQGIGRKLTEAAIAEARDMGAQGVVLQVYQNNYPALRLYSSLGFQEAAGETSLELEAVQAVAFLDVQGYRLRPWRAADSQAAYELAQRVTPRALQWMRPLKPDEYESSWWTRLGQGLRAVLAGHRLYRLAVLREEELVGLMTVTAVFRHGSHHLALLVHPDHTGQVEPALVSRALHMLAAIPPRPVQATVDKDHVAALNVLRDYGFKKRDTLLTMSQDLYRG